MKERQEREKRKERKGGRGTDEVRGQWIQKARGKNAEPVCVRGGVREGGGRSGRRGIRSGSGGGAIPPGDQDAYFTVEAALVVPIALGILVMIIYMSFYLYDRCVMSQDCYVLSYRQSIEKGNADRAGQEKIRDQLGGKLFMLSGMDAGSSAGGTIRVKTEAAMDPPLFGLPVFGEENHWKIAVERKARKTDPPKDYRRVRRLLYLASKAVPGQTADTP